MSLLAAKMTRRKQNTPKRLEGTDTECASVIAQVTQLPPDVTQTSQPSGVEDSDEEEDSKTGEQTECCSTQASFPCDRDHANDPDVRLNNRPPLIRDSTHSQHDTMNDESGDMKDDSIDTSQGSQCSSPRQGQQTQHSSLPHARPGPTSHTDRAVSAPPSPTITSSQSVDSADPSIIRAKSSCPTELDQDIQCSSGSQKDTSMTCLSSSQTDHDDQPLDLSKKTETPAPLSSASHTLPTPSTLTLNSSPFWPPVYNGLHRPNHRLSASPAADIIQISSPASFSSKLEVLPTTSSLAPRESLQKNGLSKPNLNSDSRVVGHKDDTPVVSPPLNGGRESSRQTTPPVAETPESASSNKHTFHRCSCQKSFSSLFALSLHLQETGHSPSSGKSVSLLDYPKLVRGQDMWLNQESEQTRRILRCIQCGESFKSLPLLTVHMMQTQHYTKIVNSDHGRKTHKCTTCCDHEMDREAIFKCKVCHVTFSDMEGLASHMIVSGHHKKQSSRPPIPVSSSHDTTPPTQHGKRKKCLRDDSPHCSGSRGNNFTIASLLELRKTQILNSYGLANGYHDEQKDYDQVRSPELHVRRMIPCDCCGQQIPYEDFDSHAQLCLSRKAEIIDALKNKLALEEALLSRSETKLLRSGFNLSSLPGLGRDLLHLEESVYRHSLLLRDYDTSCAKKSDTFLNEHTGHINSAYSAVSSDMSHNYSSSNTTQKLIPLNSETFAKTCDTREVPLKKWCGTEHTFRAENNQTSRNVNCKRECPTSVDNETTDSKVSKGCASVLASDSPLKATSSEEAPRVRNSLTSDKNDSMTLERCGSLRSPKDFYGGSYSALQQLDIFSRGLTLSPPKRNNPPSPNLPSHRVGELPKKKDPSPNPAASKEPKNKPPPPAQPLSPSLHLKTESELAHKEVTFDIIDPNAIPENPDSALHAMETFINKSFKSKTDFRSASMASMFSPFKNMFSMPGSLPCQNGIIQETTHPALNHFNRFSRFFKVVPGIQSFHEMASAIHLSAKRNEIREADSLQRSNAQRKSCLPRRPPEPNSTADRLDLARSDKKMTTMRFHSSSAASVGQRKHPKEATGASFNRKPGGVDRVSSSGKPLQNTSNSSHDTVCSSVNHTLNEDIQFQSPGTGTMTNGRTPWADTVSQQILEQGRKRKCERAEDIHLGDIKKRDVDSSECCSKISRNKWETRSEDIDFKNLDSKKELSPDHQIAAKNGELPNHVSKQQCSESDAGLSSAAKLWEEALKDAPLFPAGDRIKETGDTFGNQTDPRESRRVLNRTSCDPSSAGSRLSPTVCQGSPLRNDTIGPVGTVGLKNGRSVQESCSQSADTRVASRCSGSTGHPTHSQTSDTSTDVLAPCENDSVCSPEGDRQSGHDTHEDVGETPSDKRRTGGCSFDVRVMAGGDSHSNQQTNCRKSTSITASVRSSPALSSSEHGSVDLDKLSPVSDIESPDQLTEQLASQHTGSNNLAGMEPSLPACVDDDDDNDYDGVDNDDDGVDNGGCVNDRNESIRQSIVDDAHKRTVAQPTAKNMARCAKSNFQTEECSGVVRLDERFNLIKSDPDTKLKVKYRTSGQAGIVRTEADTGSTCSGDVTRKHNTSKSALEYLSSFVYHQPLSLQHPLDSLQQLLSANSVSELPATRLRCMTPDSSGVSTLGLNGASSYSRDDNEDDEPSPTEGGASHEDIREYLCPICNRRFASESSHRYHLSKCHLASVQKYGLKEAFSLSPYVYLPLDHTAKFSKYYQMAQELTKGNNT